jgi:beta-galactosidase
VLGFRAGYADEDARPRHERMPPGPLRDAVGATYGEYTNLGAPVPVTADGELALPEGGAATAWADALQPNGCEVLVRYEHPHLGRWPAVTTQAHGNGRVTYVGTLPDRALAVALGRWLRPAPDAWADRPASVTVTSGRDRTDAVVRFVSNWSWQSAGISLPVDVQDLLSDEHHRRGSTLNLEPWDVRVLRESPGDQHSAGGVHL